MNSLESVVLPLEQSRALVEKGIVLETAFVWVNEHEYDHEAGQFDGCHLALIERSAARAEHEAICSAPTLGELLDAIRAKVGDMDAECSFGIYKVDGTLQHGVAVDWVDAKDWEADRHKGAYSSTDLLAVAELLVEVSK